MATTATATSPSVVLWNRAYLMVMTCLVLVLQLMMNRFYLSSAIATLSQQYHTTTIPSTASQQQQQPPHLRQQQQQQQEQEQQRQQHRHTQSLLPEQLIQDRLPLLLQQQQNLQQQQQLQKLLPEQQQQQQQQQGDTDHPTSVIPSTTTTATPTVTTEQQREQREHFCSSKVLGEKQTWNHYKKVISYSIFGPPSSRVNTVIATTTNNNNNNTSNISDNNNLSSSSSSTTTTTTTTTTIVDIPEWVILGMEQNILDAQLYYPDWIVRIYMFDVPQELQNKWLYHRSTRYYNVELVECYSATLMTTSPSRKMISRFLAYDDPKVWYTLVRDADSRLSLREVMAVHEFLQVSLMTSFINATTNTSAAEEEKKDWLYIRSQRRNKNKKFTIHNNATNNKRRNSTMPLSIFTLTEALSSTTTTSSTSQSSTQAETAATSPIYFHVMRDHPHHTVAIMGGMFGMKRGLLQQSKRYEHVTTMSQVIDQALSAKPQFLGGCCGEDQFFLHAHLWPYVRHVTLTHDINLDRCRGFGAKVCRDFPLGPRDESIDYFVGSAFKQRFNSTTEWQVRPQHHVCTLQCHLVNDPIVPTSNANSSTR